MQVQLLIIAFCFLYLINNEPDWFVGIGKAVWDGVGLPQKNAALIQCRYTYLHLIRMNHICLIRQSLHWINCFAILHLTREITNFCSYLVWELLLFTMFCAFFPLSYSECQLSVARSHYHINTSEIPNLFTFAAKGAIYYAAITTVFFLRVKIT